MIENVFVFNPIRSDFIEKAIETLYKYTDMSNMKVVIVDQTMSGLPDIQGVHMKLRPNRNLGFAKSMNEGIIHGLHWRSKFVTCMNDDVEFINKRWWGGIIDTFNIKSQNEILAVNPESVKIPLWGYGRPPNEYIEVIDYKENFTDEDYDYLLKGDFSALKEKYPDIPASFPLNYSGVCDGVAAWGTVFKRKHFDVIGLWDERFYPGGAEDYDMMGRMYSKGFRAVSARNSWVWHHWGKSKDEQKAAQITSFPIEKERHWADLSYLWPIEWNEGHELDIWGKYDGREGKKKIFKRRPEIGRIEI
jgi:GT2 family glycosyltransferase